MRLSNRSGLLELARLAVQESKSSKPLPIGPSKPWHPKFQCTDRASQAVAPRSNSNAGSRDRIPGVSQVVCEAKYLFDLAGV